VDESITSIYGDKYFRDKENKNLITGQCYNFIAITINKGKTDSISTREVIA
jgi:hypothetical protein